MQTCLIGRIAVPALMVLACSTEASAQGLTYLGTALADVAMSLLKNAPTANAPASSSAPAMPAGHQMAPGQQMPGMNMGAQSPAWHFMQDGVVYGLFNHQGGPRGGDEFVAPNWWMGMATGETGKQQ